MARATARPTTIDDAIDRSGFGRFRKRHAFPIAFAPPRFEEELGLSSAQAGEAPEPPRFIRDPAGRRTTSLVR